MMMLYKRTINKFTKEKSAEGTKKGEKIVHDENGNVNIYRQAGDDWF